LNFSTDAARGPRDERGRSFYDRNGFVVVGGGATPDCDLTIRRDLLPTPD